MRDVYDVIFAPVVTEKTAQQMEAGNVYTFIVSQDANKIEIKSAIESIFDVTVENVRTHNVLGKVKRMGRFQGRRPSWKKAVVTLKEDDVRAIADEDFRDDTVDAGEVGIVSIEPVAV